MVVKLYIKSYTILSYYQPIFFLILW